MDSFLELLNEVDTTGFRELTDVILKALGNFDIFVDTKQYTDLAANLLDKFSFIWNPIWEIVNQWLFDLFGF